MKKKLWKFIIPFMLFVHSTAVFCYNEKSLRVFLSIQEKNIDIAEVALNLAKEFRPGLNVKKYLSIINKMVSKIKPSMKRNLDSKSKIQIFNDYFYNKFKFSYGLDDPMVQKEKNRFLTGLIDSKKGSCITLPLLYIVMAQRLDLPIYPVLAPSHTFVRYVGKDPINIEATRKGRRLSDRKYTKDFLIPSQSVSSGAYMKKLTYKEYLSELIMINAVEHFFKKNKIQQGLKYIDIAIKLRPFTPELYRAKGKMNFTLYKKYQREGKLTQASNYLTISNKMREEVKKRGYVYLSNEKYLKRVQKQKKRQRI